MSQKVNKPKDSPILQQKLRAFQPIYTLEGTIGLLVFFSILFLVYGAVLYSQADRVFELIRDYTQDCDKPVCSYNFTLPKIEPPVYVYYEVKNFYQNHREYMKSRSYKQLMGKNLTKDEISECKGVISGEELYDHTYIDGTAINDTDIANPCGLVARSVFNDTMVMYDSNGKEVKISTEGIAWKSDKDVLFVHPEDYEHKLWTDNRDERFIVWMRTAVTKNFRKMYGIISRDEPLPEGVYNFTIQNIYNVSSWHGKKKFLISNANALGGKNYMLGMVFLFVGMLCMFASLFFCGRAMISKKANISVDQLAW